MKHTFNSLLIVSLLSFILAGGALASSYQIGESGTGDSGNNQISGSSDTSAPSQGPIRLARFSDVEGDITWRPSADAEWSPASVNLPLRQGAQIWVTDGGKAEIQFDDGSLLRLGNGAVVTLQTLYSDSDGEFTEVQMNEGLATMHLLHSDSIYQVDTPLVSVKAVGPSQVRIGVDSNVEVADQSGDAVLEGGQGKADLQAGDYVYITDGDSPYQIQPLPDPDLWDQWNDQRNALLTDTNADNHLPPDLALVAGNLSDYGTWHDDPQYGWVWSPTVTSSSWRPYEHGRWVWVDPFGWTWVASENWGWAPFHYGTWIDASYGWAWVPGPAQQYWCPAVVNFTSYNGDIGWCPLAPDEVRYPAAINIGFANGNWAFDFSIGGCAAYYPENDNFCTPHPWNNRYVNRTLYTDNHVDFGQSIHPTQFHFVPRNARFASGVTAASVTAFGGHGEYHPQPEGAAFFAHGREMAAPEHGDEPFAGPRNIRPTDVSFSATRAVLPNVHPASGVMDRPIFRAPLPSNAARFAPRIDHPAVPGGRSAFPGNPPANLGRSGFGSERDPFGGFRSETPQQQALSARQGLGGRFGNGAGRAFQGAQGPIQSFSRPERSGNSFSFPQQPGQAPYRYNQGSGLDLRPFSQAHQQPSRPMDQQFGFGGQRNDVRQSRGGWQGNSSNNAGGGPQSRSGGGGGSQGNGGGRRDHVR